MADTIRAVLMAKATAASLRGLRLNRLSSHGEVAGRPGLVYWMIVVASSTSNCRSRSSPARLMPPRRCLPAVEHSLGAVRDMLARKSEAARNQAARWDVWLFGSPRRGRGRHGR
jgi:hypothetical protein